MARAQRLKFIEGIEKERGSKLIAYLTSTRQNWEVRMAMDAIRRVYDHLEAGSSSENIDSSISELGDGIARNDVA